MTREPYLISYARVSKGDDQTNAAQWRALDVARCKRCSRRPPAADGRIGGRRRKLADKQRREIAKFVVSGRKSGAEMARLYGVSEPTVSRIVATYRQDPLRLP
ncbi:helix-turn-helix domain-containing protein [Sphingomonas sp. PP-CC-3G-468]|uniref:helix-turn-helix domain-containing protein n=1 Tax=Sphingomonas sp. PP-CC-3G-468 TaxID=2135656 RepID=UPI001050558E|nr:helix-turn-helix domain-containing protein [Sphingomonas sp. PP-CC-3G-468]TCM04509.1 helix-turn-helix protein [Sphingomonas sp. PP-CC-3G-468]